MGIFKIATFNLGSKDPVTHIGKSQVGSPGLFTFLRFRPLGKPHSIKSSAPSQKQPQSYRGVKHILARNRTEGQITLYQVLETIA